MTTLTRHLSTAVLSAALAASALLASAPAATATDVPGSSTGSAGSVGSITGSLPGLPGSSTAADNLPTTFDLQAHRGGRGEHTEESRTAFEHALDLGVTTLELDIHITRDGVPLVWHDPSIQADKCTDTAPATPDDPQFPYVGKDVHDLTWDQIQTLTCDRKLADFPDAEPAGGNRILQLSDVFDLAARDPQVRFDIETKVEADHPERSADPQQFVDTILDAADAAGTTDRITVQSFDWATLPLVRERAPQVPLSALFDDSTWASGSPFLGPVDYDGVGGDVIAAAEQLGVEILSPESGTDNPWLDGNGDGGDVAGFVDRAHAAGFRVLPWTVNDVDEMTRYLDAGADGIITDYPTRLKDLLEARGTVFRG
ncbi:glycerophosphodiester phosphodiesterase family protein [Corynebacterium nuruki]|uniref:Glycerophosphodiester phosphodiesterase n=1 Tax=Corynebacterium nuruki TaxID=1032851 RepID=A0A3D4SZZ8_9CORY|nr:glycerophosphodiester phosphodiesterase family protein [Corynebacterium nuruki]HCT14843.1 glycerophosphodiester phosphodiesterase [Corynebacterium nuruki]